MDEFNHVGYVAYFGLIEIIAKENKYVIDGRLKVQPSFLKRKLRISIKKMEDIYEFCQTKDKVFLEKTLENPMKHSRFSKVFWHFYVPKITEIKDNYSAHGSEFKGLTKEVRERIRERDKDTCQYCGKHCKHSDLVIDHIVSYNKTQDSSDLNLVVACRSCNAIKRDRTPEEAGFENFEAPSNKPSHHIEVDVEEEEEVEVKKEKTNYTVEILDHLNLKASTNFRSTTKKTQQLIKARMNEGFTLENFFTVIDKKVPEWKVKPEMMQYIRPETLFGNKFEGYLNQNGNKPLKDELQGYYDKFMAKHGGVND